MSDDKTHNSIHSGLKSIATLISPFVMLAFTLIAFIYTQGQSDNQKQLIDISDKMDKIEAAISTMERAQVRHSDRMDRNAERIEENKKALHELEVRQNDLEKTVLLYNANHK